MTSTRKGFTLVELMVVLGMIAIIMGALTTSVAGARERASVQKATVETRAVAQAILGYENWNQSGGFELPTLTKAEVGKSSLGFLLGEGGNSSGGEKIPVLLMAALSSGGVMKDPWGEPYLVTIRETSVSPVVKTATGTMQSGFYLPNFYRLAEGER